MIGVWIGGNLALAVIALVMLILDVVQRRQRGVDGRFYWQAVALLLGSVIYGSIAALIEHPKISILRITMTTMALIYLLVSIFLVQRERRRR